MKRKIDKIVTVNLPVVEIWEGGSEITFSESPISKSGLRMDVKLTENDAYDLAVRYLRHLAKKEGHHFARISFPDSEFAKKCTASHDGK